MAASTAAFDALESVRIPARNGVELFARVRGGAPTSDLPLLVLIHGYPQSSHMFRFVTGLLPEKLPLFIPDIPGYGESTKAVDPADTAAYSKREIGGDILDALTTYLGGGGGGGGGGGEGGASKTGAQKPYPVVLVGHDRGARISHRLIVDAKQHANFNFLGGILLDIVPTIVQFASLARPVVAAKTFHWPFLAADHPIAASMITAFGGANFIDAMIGAWSGAAHQTRADSGGLAVYKAHFSKASVIAASCADYRAAAHVDSPEQVQDQAAGRKVDLPVLVLYSTRYLGERYDVPKVWSEWVGEKGRLAVSGTEGAVGHFIPEEDPRWTADAVRTWLKGELGLAV